MPDVADARRPVRRAVGARVRIQKHDPADGTDRHRARRGCLGHGAPDERALGGEAADECAAAGHPAGWDREQPPQRSRVGAQRVLVGAAGSAASDVPTYGLVVPAPVRLGRERSACRRAWQLVRFATAPQPDSSAGDQAAHSLLVDLEQRRDLQVGMAAELAHQQGCALRLGKLADPGHHRFQLVLDPVPAGGGLDRGVVRLGTCSAPPGEVDRRVAGDPGEPRAQLARGTLAQRDGQRRERLLGGVLGVVARSEHADADRQHARPVTLVQNRECRLVAGREPFG
jgi:hypothetical protein